MPRFVPSRYNVVPPTLGTEIGDGTSDRDVVSDVMMGARYETGNGADAAAVPLTLSDACQPPKPMGDGHVKVEEETNVQKVLDVCTTSEMFEKVPRAAKLPDTVSGVPPDKESPMLGEILNIVKTRGGMGCGTKVIPRYSEYPEAAPIAVQVTPPPPVITLSVLPSITGTPVSTLSVSPTMIWLGIAFTFALAA